MDLNLIGGLEHFLFFPYIGNVIIPTDDSSWFVIFFILSQSLSWICFCGWCVIFSLVYPHFADRYILVMYLATENGHLVRWFTKKKWWFSIVMLVYQKVIIAKPFINSKLLGCQTKSGYGNTSNWGLTWFPRQKLSCQRSTHLVLSSILSGLDIVSGYIWSSLIPRDFCCPCRLVPGC